MALLDMGYHTGDSIPPSESSHTWRSQRHKSLFIRSHLMFAQPLLIIVSFQLNVLVNRSRRGCLTDFGLANLVDKDILRWTSIQTTRHQSSGTLRWQEPELIDPPSKESVKAMSASDMYSFTCICHEVSVVSITKTILWKALIINL